MPELPEVETIVRQLRKKIIGTRCREVRFFRKDLRVPIPIQQIRQLWQDQLCTAVTRRSKYILVGTPKGAVIFHLGMSGKILLSSEKEAMFAHTHAIFHLESASSEQFLHFVDPRRFGLIAAQAGPALEDHKLFSKVGFEPLATPDLAERLFEIGKRRALPIKNFLMDASIVAGVGNIYACEALFEAGIHPLRKSSTLSRKQFVRLTDAIQNVLTRAIEAGGTSFRDYRNTDAELGAFSVELKVYGRSDAAYLRCQSPLQTLRIQGRGTWFCKRCQK